MEEQDASSTQMNHGFYLFSGISHLADVRTQILFALSELLSFESESSSNGRNFK